MDIKKIPYSLVALLILSPNVIQAAAPDFSISVQTEKQTTMVVLKPPPQHHINIKAPLFVRWVGQTKNLPQKSLTPAEARFLVNKNAKDGDEISYEASAYLCDDANTYCEKKKTSGKLILPKTNGAHSAGSSSPAIVTLPIASTAHLAGFIYNDSEKALTLARTKNKPLLIDFFGIWCPPCNQLDNTVFSTSDFKKSASRFINLKLDADDPASWNLKERYKVGGYPTVVFVDSKGDEITRVVGSRDKTEFLKILDRAWNRRLQSFTKLKAKAAAGDTLAAYEAGMIHLERQEHELALTLLKQASLSWKPTAENDPRYEKVWAAQIGALKTKIADAPVASQADLQNQMIAVMNVVLEKAKPGIFRLFTMTELADAYENLNRHEDKNKMQHKVISEAQFLLNHPALFSNEELKSVDLLQMIGASQKDLGQEKQSKETFSNAAHEYKRALNALGPASTTDRGLQLELAYCLSQAGRDGEAVMLYQQLQQKYPQEFTFYFGHARLLLQKKDLKNAEALAQKSLEYSYGDNRLRVALLLAQIYEASGNEKQATDLIEKILAQVTLPTDPLNRTHRYVKQLKSLKEKLGSRSNAGL